MNEPSWDISQLIEKKIREHKKKKRMRHLPMDCAKKMRNNKKINHKKMNETSWDISPLIARECMDGTSAPVRKISRGREWEKKA